VTQGTSAARNATRLTPIVFTFGRLIQSAQDSSPASRGRAGRSPESRVSLSISPESDWKLLKEAIPSLKSVTRLTNPANPASPSSIKEAHIAARQLGLDVRLVEIRDPVELETAVASIAQKRATAVTLIPGSFLFSTEVR
jgi:hypothetical protein